jgi:hypothetical protein
MCLHEIYSILHTSNLLSDAFSIHSSLKKDASYLYHHQCSMFFWNAELECPRKSLRTIIEWNTLACSMF